jgi:hypothetical protein
LSYDERLQLKGIGILSRKRRSASQDVCSNCKKQDRDRDENDFCSYTKVHLLFPLKFLHDFENGLGLLSLPAQEATKEAAATVTAMITGTMTWL